MATEGSLDEMLRKEILLAPPILGSLWLSYKGLPFWSEGCRRKFDQLVWSLIQIALERKYVSRSPISESWVPAERAWVLTKQLPCHIALP